MRHFLVAGLCITLLFSSCSKEEFHSGSSDYFPLSTGNYWQLGDRIRYEVVKEEELKGKKYFLVSTGYNGTWYDSTWYRADNDKVYAIPSRTEHLDEQLMFDLTAREGDSWAFNDYTVTLQGTKEKITFQGKIVTNCYLFYVDIPWMADEEYWVWLAPGIGFIQQKCSYCIDPVSTLKNARVNGVEW